MRGSALISQMPILDNDWGSSLLSFLLGAMMLALRAKNISTGGAGGSRLIWNSSILHPRTPLTGRFLFIDLCPFFGVSTYLCICLPIGLPIYILFPSLHLSSCIYLFFCLSRSCVLLHPISIRCLHLKLTTHRLITTEKLNPWGFLVPYFDFTFPLS